MQLFMLNLTVSTIIQSGVSRLSTYRPTVLTVLAAKSVRPCKAADCLSKLNGQRKPAALQGRGLSYPKQGPGVLRVRCRTPDQGADRRFDL